MTYTYVCLCGVVVCVGAHRSVTDRLYVASRVYVCAQATASYMCVPSPTHNSHSFTLSSFREVRPALLSVAEAMFGKVKEKLGLDRARFCATGM